MKKIILLNVFILFIFGTLTTNIFSERFPRVEVKKINDQFTKLTVITRGWIVNVLAFNGKDGLLLVDTGIHDTAEELKKTIKDLFNVKPKYIINTHEHIDHVGGNYIFGTDPIVISHKVLRKTLKTDIYLLEEFGDETLPDIGINNEIFLHFNGEDIHIKSFPGSHADNDLIVHFKRSKIITTGDLVYDRGFPSVDPASGNALMYSQVINKFLTYCPKDVLLINGHTKDCNYKDLLDYKNMLESTLSIARRAVKNKITLKNLLKEGSFKKWDKWQKEGYVNAKYWFKTLIDSLKFEGPKQIYITGFLYKELNNNGLEGLFKEFLRIKNSKDVKKYDITYWDIYIYGKYFERKKEFKNAQTTHEFALNEYPKEIFAYQYLSKFHKKRGNIKQAIKYLKDLLIIDPKNKEAFEQLKKINNTVN